MVQGRFATSVSCMDGRVQSPLAEWIKKTHDVDYVDVITEPGVDKIISCDGCNLDAIRAKIEISINAHKSGVIVVSGHHDCAGNPVTEEQHTEQIRKSVKVISSWGLGATVIGAWVDSKWHVSKID